jgi:hypothetical protein
MIEPDNNNLVPVNASSTLEVFLEKLNLPQVIAGPAGKAISRLVAGVLEIPAAYLDDFIGGIKNKTKAKAIVSQEVAVAAAKFAANDTDIVARAAHNLLAKEYRRQKNKEEIVKNTIDILLIEAERQPQQDQASDHSVPPSPEVDADWLNVFEKYAEDASTERVQTLWARVLAGEIRNPQRFSLSTLRFIAELDSVTAKLFETYAPFICNNDFIVSSPQLEGQLLAELLYLQDVGLIKGVGGVISKKIKLPSTVVPAPSVVFQLVNQGRVLLVEADIGREIDIPCVLLTRIATELTGVIPVPFSQVALDKVVADIPKLGVKHVLLAGNPGQVLWQEPSAVGSPEKAM